MTISSTTVKNSYNGDGSTATFTYTFKIFANSDLQVIIRSALGTETVKTLTTHYTVTGAGSASGGDITFTAGNIPVSGETVVLRRAIPQTQAIDYIANDPFPAESHEEGLDRATMAIQQLQEEVDRSIKLSRTNTITSSEFTVGAANRANKVLAFDASGELSVAQELGQFQGNWSAGETFAQRDLVKDTSNNNIYICLTAHTSSGSLPISSNADVAKWSLIVDAASATASASAAAASASAAATSESNAATSASNASSSASSAASSLSSTQTIYDNFDDRFLGTKASDPTLDNDGNALAEGSIYYNSTTNEVKFYNGSSWDAPATQSANSATASASSASSASSSASTATTQAGIATTQASNASTSASNAATSESNAATSESNAASSASTATTQATNASSSATAAAASAAAAAASADVFDDTYLGAKSSDPTVDNDGDPLTSGDLYFNTTSNELKVYNGSSWQIAAIDATNLATNGFAIAMAIAL
jgi:hypothetical protein